MDINICAEACICLLAYAAHVARVVTVQTTGSVWNAQEKTRGGRKVESEESFGLRVFLLERVKKNSKTKQTRVIIRGSSVAVRVTVSVPPSWSIGVISPATVLRPWPLAPWAATAASAATAACCCVIWFGLLPAAPFNDELEY